MRRAVFMCGAYRQLASGTSTDVNAFAEGEQIKETLAFGHESRIQPRSLHDGHLHRGQHSKGGHAQLSNRRAR